MVRLAPSKLVRVLPDGEWVVLIDESTAVEIVLSPSEQGDLIDFLLDH